MDENWQNGRDHWPWTYPRRHWYDAKGFRLPLLGASVLVFLASLVIWLTGRGVGRHKAMSRVMEVFGLRRLAPHAVGVLGTVFLVFWAGRIDRVAMQALKRTFEPPTALFLWALALLVLAGFLLAAPAWWPRPRLPRSPFSWYLAALYGIVGLFLVAPTLSIALSPWLPQPVVGFWMNAPDRLLPGIQSTSVTVRTVGCLVLGHGLGQILGSRGDRLRD